MRGLYEAVDALEHVHALTLIDIVTSRSFHTGTLSLSKVT